MLCVFVLELKIKFSCDYPTFIKITSTTNLFGSCLHSNFNIVLLWLKHGCQEGCDVLFYIVFHVISHSSRWKHGKVNKRKVDIFIN
jgi:hypothetical protein